jgi:non-haem Fe2+, alpha-ketoglutarate-dependent halogenase
MQSDLSQKDLSFEPCKNLNPKTLSKKQIEDYNELGYISGLTAFEGEQADTQRSRFDRLLEEFKKNGKNDYAINGFHSACESIYEIVMNKGILNAVEDLIGPNIVAWGTHYFTKPPHDEKKVPMHQDASYWPFTPSRTVTCWLAIDDADIENAAMQFLPKTHNVGHLDWKDSADPSVLNQEIINVEQYGKPFDNILKAGQFSLHADMLAHGSNPNTSDRRRCGLTIRYCPTHVKSLNEGWAKNSILCRGEDNTDNWVHKPRPVGENIFEKIIAIGGN